MLLPVFGAASAMIAFKVAAPLEGTLNRPGMSLLDPQAQFTFGTAWGDVNRFVFGAVLCGLFCLGLTAGRRSWIQVVAATSMGAVFGGIINFVTDSGSDFIGLSIAKTAGMVGNLIAMVAWCVLVPAGISLALLLALGPTPQRFKRACAGAVWATVAAGIAQMVAPIFDLKHAAEPLARAIAGDQMSLSSFIPTWRAQEIAVGIAFGLAMAFVDSRVRVGTLRLVLGKNEVRDWSLDHQISRVGSAEGIEIPLGPIPGVEKLHALVVRQGDRFILDTQGRPAQLNGRQVAQSDLNHYDTIQLGAATLQFLAGSVVVSGPYRPVSPRPAPPAAISHSIPDPGHPSGPVPLGVLVDSAGGQYHLPPGQYGVGREADNAICLSRESSVSRYHATIVVTQDGTQLADIGSTNGTFVNGSPVVGETPLRPGDRLQFGCVQFTVDRVPTPANPS